MHTFESVLIPDEHLDKSLQFYWQHFQKCFATVYFLELKEWLAKDDPASFVPKVGLEL